MMNLAHLINEIKVIQATGDIGKVDISSIVYDSRKVKKGSLFIAIKGFKEDGNKYIEQAIAKGAVAVVTDSKESMVNRAHACISIPQILVNDARQAMAELSHKFYNYPSRRLKIIGVTGTNGKTSITYIIKTILEEAGYKVGLIGTIENLIGQKSIESTKTTPEAPDLCEIFNEMINKKCDYCVMEVSSHSLDLKRVYGINFIAGIFTNLTQDHLDYHKTFENYFQAKKILFDSLSEDSIAISNIDDEYGEKIVKDSKSKIYFYGTNLKADYRILNSEYDFEKMTFEIETKGRRINIETFLIGEFNIFNITAAVGLCCELGIADEKIIRALTFIRPIPGRFELVRKSNKYPIGHPAQNWPIKVIVDYAHTPDALRNCLLSINKIRSKNEAKYGRIITVFGAGGDRDKDKRPLMAQVVEPLSDKIIITSDNPRSEDPQLILRDIAKGFSYFSFMNKVEVIESRSEAIHEAIYSAFNNDIILIAGKGHEKYMEIDGEKIPFNDVYEARQNLKMRFGDENWY